MYRRHRNNEIYTITTNKTTVELTLSPNENYVVQIKSLSEGGLGEGSEPIHIHQHSKFNFLFFYFALPDSLHRLQMAIQSTMKKEIISPFSSPSMNNRLLSPFYGTTSELPTF